MNDFDIKALDWDNDPINVERAKKIADEIRKYTVPTKKMSGLDYGCGTGLLSFNLQPYLNNIKLMDSSDGMLEVLNNMIVKSGFTNMTPVKIDLSEELPPNDHYDLIFTSMTLHHIMDTEKILKTFHSLLNLSGYLCISDLDEEDGTFHGKDFVGHNGFNRHHLIKMLEEIGFSLIHNSICFEMPRKTKEGITKSFPIFLMIAQKK